MEVLEIEDVKEAVIQQSIQTILKYQALCEGLMDHLMGDDISLQQNATLTAKVLHLFITEEAGFKTWADALVITIEKESSAQKELLGNLH